MNSTRTHGPIFVALVAVVYAAFGYLTSTPLWESLDMQIITDAHRLSLSPGAMFNHLGFYFSQPLLQIAFLAEYHFFGLNTGAYLLVNLFVHAINAFVVYMLVNMLFPQRRMALLASLLFALGVGSYGRVFMTIHQLEGLMIAGLHLLVLYFFIRNDFRRQGRVMSPLFVIGMGLFLVAGLTKAASFSLLGCLIAYKVLFYHHRNRRSILSPDILVFLVVGVLFYLGQHNWGYQHPIIIENTHVHTHFSPLSLKNIFRYLNLMFFPLQKSPILEMVPTWIVLVYKMHVAIRVILTLSIVSYSFFGFVFGSRAVRFFIAWTYITLLPFTSHTEAGQWLNLSHLYLTSLGFCVILAAGATGTSRLLTQSGWRRFLPYIIPLYFAGISLGVASQLNRKNNLNARLPEVVTKRSAMLKRCQERPGRIINTH